MSEIVILFRAGELAMHKILIEIREAKKYFARRTGIFSSRSGYQVKAVEDISFHIASSEVFGLVGESGCGKTTICKLLLLLEELTSGSILFEDKDIYAFSREELVHYRTSVQMMFQDPFGSLNPRMRVGESIGEPLLENSRLSKNEIRERVQEVVAKVGLPNSALSKYSHQFSGGQRQRIALARAVILSPLLIVLDEPVSALDVSVRAQIINLLMDIHHTTGMSYLLVAHDLSVVKHMCNRVGVMYLGKLVEFADSRELYLHPVHPYTQALFSAILPPRIDGRRKVVPLPGEVPNAVNPPTGCRFHPRCRRAIPLCSEIEPLLKEIAPGHFTACNLYDQSSNSGQTS